MSSVSLPAKLLLISTLAPPVHVLAEDFQLGQIVIVVSDSTALMHGQRVLTNLPRGRKAEVQQVRGPWVLVRAGDNLGWVRGKDLAPEADDDPTPPGDDLPRSTIQDDLGEASDAIWPHLGAYRKQFRRAARATFQRRQNDPAALEVLRDEVDRWQNASDLNEDLIAQVEPSWTRLDVLLTVDRRVVLQLTPQLAEQRRSLLTMLRPWEKAAAERAAREDAAPHEKLTDPPTAEHLVRWQEELAIQLELAGDEQYRQVLEANARPAALLDPAEAEGVHAINRLRLVAGLAPLQIDSALTAAARDHSHAMHTRDFFSHESPIEGKRWPIDRAKFFGTTAWSENISWGSHRAARTIDMWFHSPGHLSNMLDTTHRRMGIGRSLTHWTLMLAE